jgi:peptide/nickel transport system ATP-binding protein
VPRLGQAVELKRTGTPLSTIRGNVPSLRNLPKGCAFANRCDHAIAACGASMPALAEATPTQKSRCIRWQEL